MRDEPTSRQDVSTKEMLNAALSQCEGTMLFVSHDLKCVAALSNRVLEPTPTTTSSSEAAVMRNW